MFLMRFNDLLSLVELNKINKSDVLRCFLGSFQKMPAFQAEKPGGSNPDSTVVARKHKSAIFRTHIKCGTHKKLSYAFYRFVSK